MTKKVYTFDLLQSIINELCIQDDRSGRVFGPPVANWRERLGTDSQENFDLHQENSESIQESSDLNNGG